MDSKFGREGVDFAFCRYGVNVRHTVSVIRHAIDSGLNNENIEAKWQWAPNNDQDQFTAHDRVRFACYRFD